MFPDNGEEQSLISTGLIPTRRAVIDINRACNAKCRMCYYTYEQSDWSKPLEMVQNELRASLERGNTSVDFTGGEPTIYPQMAEVIRYAESIGLHTCIITNGLALEKVKTGGGRMHGMAALHTRLRGSAGQGFERSGRMGQNEAYC